MRGMRDEGRGKEERHDVFASWVVRSTTIGLFAIGVSATVLSAQDIDDGREALRTGKYHEAITILSKVPRPTANGSPRSVTSPAPTRPSANTTRPKTPRVEPLPRKAELTSGTHSVSSC